MDASVEQFIDQLIDEKNYETLTDEVRQQMKQDLAQRLYDQIDQAMINALPEDKVEELNTRLDGDISDEELAKFMEDAGVDMQQVVLQTMLTFRALFLTPPRDEQAPAVSEEPGETAPAEGTNE